MRHTMSDTPTMKTKRPRPKRIAKPNRLGLRLEDDLLEWLRRREDAQRNGVSFAIRQILLEKMAHEGRRGS